MAPEQIKGRPREASDQYALAVTVYEWLTGRRPFDGPTYIEVTMKHLTDPSPPLDEGTPALVSSIVLKAVSKNPQARYASIQDFAFALQTAAQAADQPLQPTITLEPARLAERWNREGVGYLNSSSE